jgi:hypothetical protein
LGRREEGGGREGREGGKRNSLFPPPQSIYIYILGVDVFGEGFHWVLGFDFGTQRPSNLLCSATLTAYSAF